MTSRIINGRNCLAQAEINDCRLLASVHGSFVKSSCNSDPSKAIRQTFFCMVGKQSISKVVNNFFNMTVTSHLHGSNLYPYR